MRSRLCFVLSLLALALGLNTIWAQPYAITATVMVTRFSGGLESYDDPGRVVVSLLSTDAREEYPVLLRFRFSSGGVSIATRPDFLPEPVILRRYQPTVLTGAQLREYFDPDNLAFGIQGFDYFLSEGGSLPEGPISLCVEVHDYNRFFDPPVSNTACSNGFLQLHRPPVLLEPGPQVTASTVQQLRFVWQPMHVGVAATYTLELYEDLPGFAPNLVLEATPPLSVIHTFTPFYLYTAANPALLPGQDYLVRIRAQDPSGQASFLNGGWSEVYRFHYGGREAAPDCGSPDTPDLWATTDSSLLWRWSTPDSVDAWRIRYRPRGYLDWLLLPATALEAGMESGTYQALLPGLVSDTDYELELCRQCPDGSWACAELARGRTALTPSPPPTDSLATDSLLSGRCRISLDGGYDYQCGDPANIAPFGDVPLITELAPGDSVWAADFLVVLTEVRGNGSFSGAGYTSVPYFNQARMRLTFDNIQVNAHCRMVAGQMQLKGATLAILEDINELTNDLLEQLDNLDNLLAQAEGVLVTAQQVLNNLASLADYHAAQQALEALAQSAQDFPFVPDSVSNNIQAALDCLDQAQGQAQFDSCKQQLQTAINDFQQAVESLYQNAPRQVVFQANPGQAHGFDAYQYEAHRDQYTHLRIAQSDYHVAWKATASGQTDRVDASGASLEGIHFVDPARNPIPRTDSSGIATLSVRGGAYKGSPQVVYATHQASDSTTTIAGQLHVAAYNPQTLRVVLVPVNGAAIPAGIQPTLSRILGQAVVQVELVQHPGLSVADFDGSMSTLPAGFAANYNDEMQAIIRAFKQGNETDGQTKYVFLIPSSEDPQRLGYMPRSRRWGFVYLNNHANASGVASTLAHELAHGAYNLEHTFDTYPELPPGSTENLMDYAGGSHLHKYQWDLIHDPVAHIALFDEEEEGALIASVYPCDITFNYTGNQETYTCFTPAGQLYGLPKAARAHFHPAQGLGWPAGALKSFDWQGQTYIGWTQDNLFLGYAPARGGKPDPSGFLASQSGASADWVFAATYAATSQSCEAGVDLYGGSSSASWYQVDVPLSLTNSLPLQSLAHLADAAQGSAYFEESCQCVSTNLAGNLDCLQAEGPGTFDPSEQQEMVSLLNEHITNRDGVTASVRDKAFKVHIMATSNSQIGLDASQRDYLEENLYLLKYYTQTDFYVIFHRVGELYTRAQLRNLTEAVFNASQLANRPRALLVIIPYTVNEDGLLDVNNCGSIALQASPGLLGSDCEADGNDAASYLMAIFRCVPKPAYVSRVTMLVNEHLIETHSSSAAGAWVRGNDFINKLVLYRSPHIDRLKHLLSTSTGFATADYNMALNHWQLYCEQMEQAIQLDNEAIAQNNAAYWENLTDQVKLRDGFIRDQEYLMAYALYQFNYRETPIYATGQALIQQEITEEQLYSQLNAWTLADQLVYPALDFVGLIPGVDIGADLVGFFYAQIRGDMQQIPLYAMALVIPPGFDNIAHYGGRGTSRMVALYTENGITYAAKQADEPIDEAVEAVRASVLTHDPVIAQAIIDADVAHLFHEADHLYQNRYSAILSGTGGSVSAAKVLVEYVVRYCPLLKDHPQLLNSQLAEVIHHIADPAENKKFLEALQRLGSATKLEQFSLDLAQTPALVQAFREKPELLSSWTLLHPSSYRTHPNVLAYYTSPSVVQIHEMVLTGDIPSLFPDIPVEELTAIRHYSTSAYQQLNSALRNGNPSPFHQGFAELVNTGLARLPAHPASTTYRGVYGEEANLAKTWTIGQEVRFDDFKSTTESEEVSLNFIFNNNGDVMYEISEVVGHDICRISCVPGEMEILLRSGARFRVSDVELFTATHHGDDYDIHIIFLEHLGY